MHVSSQFIIHTSNVVLFLFWSKLPAQTFQRNKDKKGWVCYSISISHVTNCLSKICKNTCQAHESDLHSGFKFHLSEGLPHFSFSFKVNVRLIQSNAPPLESKFIIHNDSHVICAKDTLFLKKLYS
jgi:hypothetical protein